MSGYKTRTRPVKSGVAAVGMTAITFGLLLVVPAEIEHKRQLSFPRCIGRSCRCSRTRGRWDGAHRGAFVAVSRKTPMALSGGFPNIRTKQTKPKGSPYEILLQRLPQ